MPTPHVLPCLALVAAALVGCSNGEPPPSPTSPARSAPQLPTSSPRLDIEAERAAVREVFLGYRRAITAQQGEVAFQHTSAKTIDHFESVRVAALEMPETKLRAAPLMDKIMILSLRARLTRAQLEGSTGKELFVMGIDRGWTGDDVAQLEPAEIRIDGDTARIGIRKGDIVLPSAAGFRAHREGSVWKLDVMSIQRFAEPTLRKAIQEIDPDEDKAITQAVALLTEKKVGPEIWQPLRQPASDKR